MKLLVNKSNSIKWNLLLLICFHFFICLSQLHCQSITCDDLINLQKSSIEKASGFFNYSGFNLISTERNINAFIYHEYTLDYDRLKWKKNIEEIRFLSKSGFKNIIIYYTDNQTFSNIESQVKNKFKFVTSIVNKNIFTNYYQDQSIDFFFSTITKKEYSSVKTYYEIDAFISNDLDSRIQNLCANCKGTGQIIEFEKCHSCSGDGIKNCPECDGVGHFDCRYCDHGKLQCYNCNGNGKMKCPQCYGQGKVKCNKCYGSGRLSYCEKCKGTGQITTQVAGGFMTMTSTCTACAGKGSGNFTCESCTGYGYLECSYCSGKGELQCGSCAGTGKITCSKCKGDYSKKCSKCAGTGNTDLVCSYCSGTGLTNKEIKKICSACSGSGLKNK